MTFKIIPRLFWLLAQSILSKSIDYSTRNSNKSPTLVPLMRNNLEVWWGLYSFSPCSDCFKSVRSLLSTLIRSGCCDGAMNLKRSPLNPSSCRLRFLFSKFTNLCYIRIWSQSIWACKTTSQEIQTLEQKGIMKSKSDNNWKSCQSLTKNLLYLQTNSITVKSNFCLYKMTMSIKLKLFSITSKLSKSRKRFSATSLWMEVLNQMPQTKK